MPAQKASRLSTSGSLSSVRPDRLVLGRKIAGYRDRLLVQLSDCPRTTVVRRANAS